MYYWLYLKFVRVGKLRETPCTVSIRVFFLQFLFFLTWTLFMYTFLI
jgi:hypothetical protein